MIEKNYSCKNEELPVIAGYLLFTIKRDLNIFTDFSPKFNAAYVAAFEAKTNQVTHILNPRAETVDMKAVTENLYAAMDRLLDPIAKLERYVKLAGSDVPVNVKDFGLSKLRKRIWARDAEGVLDGLKTVNSYIDAYATQLEAQGLSEGMINLFLTSSTTINDYNQKQYEIFAERKVLVETNQQTLNELYKFIAEVCDIGKVIFRGNPALTKAYTFSELKKRVRIVYNSPIEKASENADTASSNEE